MVWGFFLTLPQIFKTVQQLGSQDVSPNASWEETALLSSKSKNNNREKLLLLDRINYLQFSSLFSTAGYKEIASGKICISTKQIENSLNHWSIYLYLFKRRHFNPINGKLYYLLWKQTWKKYLKHAVNYDTKWHIIFLFLSYSLSSSAFTNCESRIHWSLETDAETDRPTGTSAVDASFYR